MSLQSMIWKHRQNQEYNLQIFFDWFLKNLIPDTPNIINK